ncbi:glycosyltransferase family 4 protein [Glycomyces terrestris]|uniref:Glycosyltransferase n=1 Tax=Glycomyces terrestris TaxID=2493553 RepID=A0A426UUM7_9ACTN|nr:glycosyltransferase family 4 protein [Glycomyces terrestris]RRR97685.1 glycosyltransferase [Glycomyces terrestris]
METQTRPPRVVMVVANRIDGDSRVQKAAQSMAEDGWDVHLVGFSVSGKEERHRRGGYTVHRCPLPELTEPPRLRDRVARLRFPLAYADADRALEVPHRVRAARIDLEADRLERSRARDDGLLRAARGVRRLGRRVEREWLERRAASTEKRVRFTEVEEGDLERLERRWWTALLGDRAWKRLDLNATRIELALRLKIIRLKPDLLHAHDVYPLGICARAAAHLRSRGRDVKLVYDAHEFRPGFDAQPPAQRIALTGYERRYLPHADAVVTVSEPLAELLRDTHGLDRLPAVVLNAPLRPDPDRPHPGDIRSSCGLDAAVPLAVYAGWASPERRLEEMIEAARLVPDLHLALVVSRHRNPYVQSLKALAESLGIGDRVHFRGYVDYADLPRFLETADIGVYPLQTGPVNHEVSLPNKYFEYSHARLPMVVSNVAAMSAEVRRLGSGEVYTSGDAEGLAAAVRRILADPAAYRRAYRDPAILSEYSWERQARHYTALYEELLGPAPARAAAPEPARDELRERAGAPADQPVVAVLDGGPGDEWTATAVRGLAGLTEVRTVVVCPDPARTAAFADAVVPTGPVGAFLSTAAAVVLPAPAREDTLPPQLPLALEAGVPVLLPATPATERYCERHRVGQTARADDPAAVTAAVKQLLADPDRVRHVRARARLGSATPWPRLDPGDAVRLGLGPVDGDGQLAALAKAVAWHFPDTGVEVVALRSRGVPGHPADETFTAAELGDPGHRERRAAQVLGYTHLLADWGGPVLGGRGDLLGDLPSLRSAGVRAALLLHGGGLRDPEGHAARHAHSVYRDLPEEVRERLLTTAAQARELARASGLPLFATAPDLLDDLPEAVWLPLTADVDRWHSDAPVMERARPVVLRAPSDLPAGDDVAAVLERLDAAGKIAYRPVEGLPPARVRDLVRGADLVVDRFGLGCYGPFAVAAMAAGRPVLADLHESAAARTGEEPPVVRAAAPALEAAVVALVEDPDRARELGAESRRFARRVHDGRAAAEALRPFLER